MSCLHLLMTIYQYLHVGDEVDEGEYGLERGSQGEVWAACECDDGAGEASVGPH